MELASRNTVDHDVNFMIDAIKGAGAARASDQGRAGEEGLRG
jgi:hypothetical protein